MIYILEEGFPKPLDFSIRFDPILFKVRKRSKVSQGLKKEIYLWIKSVK